MRYLCSLLLVCLVVAAGSCFGQQAKVIGAYNAFKLENTAVKLLKTGDSLALTDAIRLEDNGRLYFVYDHTSIGVIHGKGDGQVQHLLTNKLQYLPHSAYYLEKFMLKMVYDFPSKAGYTATSLMIPIQADTVMVFEGDNQFYHNLDSFDIKQIAITYPNWDTASIPYRISNSKINIAVANEEVFNFSYSGESHMMVRDQQKEMNLQKKLEAVRKEYTNRLINNYLHQLVIMCVYADEKYFGKAVETLAAYSPFRRREPVAVAMVDRFLMFSGFEIREDLMYKVLFTTGK